MSCQVAWPWQMMDNPQSVLQQCADWLNCQIDWIASIWYTNMNYSQLPSWVLGLLLLSDPEWDVQCAYHMYNHSLIYQYHSTYCILLTTVLYWWYWRHHPPKHTSYHYPPFACTMSSTNKRKRKASQYRDQRNEIAESFDFVDTTSFKASPSLSSSSTNINPSNISQQPNTIHVTEWNIETNHISTTNSLISTMVPIGKPEATTSMHSTSYVMASSAPESYPIIDVSDMMIPLLDDEPTSPNRPKAMKVCLIYL